MKNIIYIVTLVLVFSCKAQKNTQETIVGTYETKTDGVFGKIILNKDSSFLYRYNVGLIKTESKGSWKFVDGVIILKSNEEYLTNQIQVKEYNDKGELIIKDPQDNPIQGAYVVLNNEQKALETDSKGVINIDENIEVFEIHYLGETYKYKIVDDKANSYNVTLYLSDLT